MITLKRLRELEPKLMTASDQEVALIREKIYEMANLAMDSYQEHKDSKLSVGSDDMDDTK